MTHLRAVYRSSMSHWVSSMGRMMMFHSVMCVKNVNVQIYPNKTDNKRERYYHQEKTCLDVVFVLNMNWAVVVNY